MRLTTLILLLADFVPTAMRCYVVSPPPPPNRPTFVMTREARPTTRFNVSLRLSCQKPTPDKADTETTAPDVVGRRRRKEEQPMTKPMTLAEYAEKEQKAARDLDNRLTLPDRIGKAVNATLYAVVILGFVLNLFGYAYVRKPDGSIYIGTIEARRFQDEINRTITRPQQGGKD